MDMTCHHPPCGHHCCNNCFMITHDRTRLCYCDGTSLEGPRGGNNTSANNVTSSAGDRFSGAGAGTSSSSGTYYTARSSGS
jgi:hypothetical protein